MKGKGLEIKRNSLLILTILYCKLCCVSQIGKALISRKESRDNRVFLPTHLSLEIFNLNFLSSLQIDFESSKNKWFLF